ncbi:MAG: DUF6089 family protein [Polaribacter sp.]|jgi:hypothetical protein|nr:DUF6089 family protein [Polaribacter sp.]MDG1953898.1 DUF6089 family protein [Polaribacter sp.]MDG2073899.1 DUF6089 family protein [Polaribacter sp.]
MKKQLLAIVFICISSISWSQINEIGVFIGGSNYIGDVGKSNYINPNNIAGGLIYKYNVNPRIALRGTLSFLSISGDDAKSSNLVRVNRSFNFTNSIKEVAVGIEYNFFEYDMTSEDKIYTPYILLEVAAFGYDSVESEITPGQYNLNTKISYGIPFGLGFKGRLAEKIGFSLETRVRYTFTDDLDYTTNKIPSLNFGGNSNDWYMFTGISIVYAFGRPACYVDLR